MKFFKLSFAAFLLSSSRTAAQNIGGGNNNDTDIVGGTDVAVRVRGFVSSGGPDQDYTGYCGGILIHDDIVVSLTDNQSCYETYNADFAKLFYSFVNSLQQPIVLEVLQCLHGF